MIICWQKQTAKQYRNFLKFDKIFKNKIKQLCNKTDCDAKTSKEAYFTKLP